jgi:hypothetical protein
MAVKFKWYLPTLEKISRKLTTNKIKYKKPPAE